MVDAIKNLEFEYKVADQEWALGQLCLYLGVTKGSLTADELRAALYEHLHQPAVPPSLPGANGPANLEGSTNPDEGCDPPAVSPGEACARSLLDGALRV